MSVLNRVMAGLRIAAVSAVLWAVASVVIMTLQLITSPVDIFPLPLTTMMLFFGIFLVQGLIVGIVFAVVLSFIGRGYGARVLRTVPASAIGALAGLFAWATLILTSSFPVTAGWHLLWPAAITAATGALNGVAIVAMARRASPVQPTSLASGDANEGILRA